MRNFQKVQKKKKGEMKSFSIDFSECCESSIFYIVFEKKEIVVVRKLEIL